MAKFATDLVEVAEKPIIGAHCTFGYTTARDAQGSLALQRCLRARMCSVFLLCLPWFIRVPFFSRIASVTRARIWGWFAGEGCCSGKCTELTPGKVIQEIYDYPQGLLEDGEDCDILDPAECRSGWCGAAVLLVNGKCIPKHGRA